MRRAAFLSAVWGLTAASAAYAHPHFNKTVSVTLPSGVDATITYNTTPANETRAASVPVGTFVTPRKPMLKLSAEVKAGDVTVPAGEYTIGVIKNSDKDWTMALYPGPVPQGSPDVAKALKLESVFSTDHGIAEHMLIDITPGTGKLEGRAVLTLHFGNLFLAGALSPAAPPAPAPSATVSAPPARPAP
jgi:hypothetical protein